MRNQRIKELIQLSFEFHPGVAVDAAELLGASQKLKNQLAEQIFEE